MRKGESEVEEGRERNSEIYECVTITQWVHEYNWFGHLSTCGALYNNCLVSLHLYTLILM